MLSKTNKTFIREHSFRELPNECCGLVFSDNEGDSKIFECRNKSSKPTKHFEIDPMDYVSASRLGKITGTYHSHPNSNDAFSEFDKHNSKNHNLIYYLYCTSKNIFLEYDPNQEFNSYVGRTFKIGSMDCLTLVKDFYLNELSIKINDYHRDCDWKKNSKFLIDDNYGSEGFSKVSGDYKKYDCHLFKFKNEASEHIAINLGDDLILHQPRDGYSRIEKLTEKHKKFINFTVRHKELA